MCKMFPVKRRLAREMFVVRDEVLDVNSPLGKKLFQHSQRKDSAFCVHSTERFVSMNIYTANLGATYWNMNG